MQANQKQTRATHGDAERSFLPLTPLPGADLDEMIFGSLLALLGLDTTSSIFSEFLAQTRQRLEAFLQRPDPPALQGLAHTLKGSAGMLGAQAVSRLAAQLEEAPYPGAEAEWLLQSMLDACESLQVKLRERQVAV